MADFGDTREENVVTYEIFDLRLLSKDDKAAPDIDETLYEILSYSQSLIRDYIWQKGVFNLKAHGHGDGDGGDTHTDSDIFGHTQSVTQAKSDASESIACLKGSTDFADNIEDEWFIVYILQSISKKFPDVAIKLTDNDGEFLLIECANFLPKWLEPGTSGNRVFLHRGNLHIIPLPRTPSEIVVFPIGKPSMLQALEILQGYPDKTIALPWIQEPVMSKIEEYPTKTNFHHVRCCLPKPLKYLLERKPSLIAPVVLAFVNRDPVENKKCQELKHFPFKALVPHRVCFTRCLYAQLAKQNFIPTKSATKILPEISSASYKAHVLGLQLTYGLEIIFSQKNTAMSDDPTRLTKPTGHQWEKYLSALKGHGYFRNEVEGSKLYCQLMEKAQEYFSSNFLNVETSSDTTIAEIEKLLEGMPDTNNSSSSKADVKELDDDDESWLEISPTELESILSQYGSHLSSGDEDLTNVVQGMNSFVKTISSYEGAEFPSELNNEDLDIQFDADDFMKTMDSFFMKPGEYSDTHSSEDGSSYDDDDDFDITPGDDEQYNEYTISMDRELSATSVGRSFVKVDEMNGDTKESCETQSEPPLPDENDAEVKPVDIDLNLVQNLLESFSLQEGMPGPVSNIFNSMGIPLPQHLTETDQQDMMCNGGETNSH